MIDSIKRRVGKQELKAIASWLLVGVWCGLIAHCLQGCTPQQAMRNATVFDRVMTFMCGAWSAHREELYNAIDGGFNGVNVRPDGNSFEESRNSNAAHDSADADTSELDTISTE